MSLLIKARPGTFGWIFFLNRPSLKLDQLPYPPMLVTPVLPITTWLLDMTVAFAPSAVALVKALLPVELEIKEADPMAVLLPPVVL